MERTVKIILIDHRQGDVPDHLQIFEVKEVTGSTELRIHDYLSKTQVDGLIERIYPKTTVKLVSPMTGKV